MMEKIILTDADGTIVWWLKGFVAFMEEKGFTIQPGFEHEYKMSLKYGIPSSIMEDLIREFNESPHIGRLEALADSVKYIGKLHDEHGFKFICVTSQSDAPIAKVYRELNLMKHFGTAFSEVNCIKMGAHKEEELSRWKDSGYFWIEDHPHQAKAGVVNGLKSVLITHPYNTDTADEKITRVSRDHPWEEIYNIVLKEYQITDK